MSVEGEAPLIDPSNEQPAPTTVVEGETEPYMFKPRESTFFPPGKIKKIMLADQEVGKIKKETPSLLGMCVEMFIEQLIAAAVEETQADNARLISAGHLKRAVKRNMNWDFLHGLVERIADLPENTDKEPPKRQRKKKASAGEEGEVGEKKPTVKRSGGKRSAAKAASEPQEQVELTYDPTTAVAQDGEAEGAEDVFVPVSIASASSAAGVIGPMATIAQDDDDFDS